MKDLKKAIDLITVEKLEKVLSFLKWRELDVLMNGRVRQFVSPDGEYVALIPLVKEFSDYYRVMEETLQSIASFENRNIAALINKILNPILPGISLAWQLAIIAFLVFPTDL